MSIEGSSIIKQECNNWYCREEDRLVQICNQDGIKVILNQKGSIVWTAIHYESSMDALWEKVKDSMSLQELTEAVLSFQEFNLISVINEENEFDAIFN